MLHSRSATPRRAPVLRTAATLLFALAPLAACGDDDAVGPGEARTVTELAAETPQLSTLTTALETANLAEALDGGGPFTVFAPVNDGFTALPAGTVDALLATDNRPILTALLQHHVVPGTWRAADLSDGQELITLAGDTLTVGVAGDDVTVDGVAVRTADVAASNGVVHLIDGVLTEGLDAVQRARVTPSLSALVAAVEAAGLDEALADDGSGTGLTLFAPTNDAFAAFGDTLPSDPGTLIPLLQAHAAPGRVLAADLSDGQMLTTLSGVTLTVEVEGSTVRLVGPNNTVTVVTADIRTSNGVVHLIDGVLRP